jgi:PAS domain-containing protein
MPNTATVREQRLRKTKAQLIDEIDTLEQRAAAIEATNRELAEKEAQLLIALDSMPGLLVYTDENLNIVLCNERFSEMYQAEREMLQPGQPYPDFLCYLAEQGYYGEGDAEALVAERVESLRNPSSKTFPRSSRTPSAGRRGRDGDRDVRHYPTKARRRGAG